MLKLTYLHDELMNSIADDLAPRAWLLALQGRQHQWDWLCRINVPFTEEIYDYAYIYIGYTHDLEYFLCHCLNGCWSEWPGNILYLIRLFSSVSEKLVAYTVTRWYMINSFHTVPGSLGLGTVYTSYNNRNPALGVLRPTGPPGLQLL